MNILKFVITFLLLSPNLIYSCAHESKEPKVEVDESNAAKKKKKKKNKKKIQHKQIENLLNQSIVSSVGQDDANTPLSINHKIAENIKRIQSAENEIQIIQNGLAKFLAGHSKKDKALKGKSHEEVLSEAMIEKYKENISRYGTENETWQKKLDALKIKKKVTTNSSIVKIEPIEGKKLPPHVVTSAAESTHKCAIFDGNSDVAQAVKRGDKAYMAEVAKLLRAEDILKKAGPTATPLHRAVIYGDYIEVARLIKMGFKIDQKAGEDFTALHFAAELDDAEIAKILIAAGANIEAKAVLDRTPLHIASYEDSINVLNILLQAGANKEAKMIRGKTSLLLASQKGYKEIVQSLINAGSDIESRISDDPTPLHIASINGRMPIIKMLLDAGANINSRAVDHTPVYFASTNHQIEAVRLLLENGAEASDPKNPKVITNALGVSEKNGDLIRNILLNKTGIIDSLIKIQRITEADINFQDKSGMTALMWAIIRHPELVNRLLSYCGDNDLMADLTLTNNDGQTALSLAMKRYNKGVVSSILRYISPNREVARRECAVFGFGSFVSKLINSYLYGQYRHKCDVCNADTTLKCSVCKLAYYCSLACQKVDWKSHKINCKEIEKPVIYDDKVD